MTAVVPSARWPIQERIVSTTIRPCASRTTSVWSSRSVTDAKRASMSAISARRRSKSSPECRKRRSSVSM